MRKRDTIVLLMAGIVLLAGCQKTGPFGGKSAVSFTAVSKVGTKTAYSGVETEEGSRKYERIDWKQGDLIRVWSDVAVHRYNKEQHWSDYIVTADGIANKRISTASLAAQNLNNVPGDGTGNGLVWGPIGSYTFHAVYPAQEIVASTNGREVTTSCVIPDTQQITFVKGIGKPDMSHAYMEATATATTTIEGEGVPVTLPFKPAFTAFEITLRSASETLYLDSFSIQSEGGSPVAGSFSIVFGHATDLFQPVSGSTQSQVTIPLNDTELSATADLKFTVLALPETFSDLSITFNVKTDPTATTYLPRTLQLKQDGEYIRFGQCIKHRLYGLALSAETWKVLAITGEDLEWDEEVWGENIIWEEL